MSITGAGTAAGVAEESTWGTAVTPATNWRYVINADAAPDFTRVQSGRISSGYFANDVEAAEDASASLSLEMTYENLGMWLEHALWSVAATTGTGPYTHVYNGSDNSPIGLTLHVVLGDSGNGRQMVGSLVNTWSLAISVGTPFMTLGLEMIGKQVTQISAATPTYGAGDEVVSGLDAALMSWNSNTFCLRSITINGSNGLERRRCLSESTTAKPQPVSERTIDIEFELDFNANITTDFAARVEANASIVFTGSGNNVMTFLMRNMLILSVSDPISGPGVVTQRVTARCRENPAGTYPFQVTIVNDNASGSAN
tara:strand:+ start:5991 stop:6929 length:939 start_codon:yes stop_codon:yes gene_type:complete